MKQAHIDKYKNVIDIYYTNGRNRTEAYMEVYPDAKKNTAAVDFCRILTLPQIKEYIKQKDADIIEIINIKTDTLLIELEEVKRIGYDTGNMKTVLAAIEMQGKMIGAFDKHNAQKQTVINNELPIIKVIELTVEQ